MVTCTVTDVELEHPKPKIGLCPHLFVEIYEGSWGHKAITICTGPPELGGSIILRGAPLPILKEVKDVLEVATLATIPLTT